MRCSIPVCYVVCSATAGATLADKIFFDSWFGSERCLAANVVRLRFPLETRLRFRPGFRQTPFVGLALAQRDDIPEHSFRLDDSQHRILGTQMANKRFCYDGHTIQYKGCFAEDVSGMGKNGYPIPW